MAELDRCTPLYEEVPGWEEDITQVTDYEDLPANAKHFLDRIVELSETPLATISVGPSREQTIILRDPWRG